MAVKKQGRRKDKETKGPTLTEKAIEKHVGERSLRLGREYVAGDAIFRTRREGDVLKAHCRGQSADHYVLSARVKDGRIAAAECNCPVGDGGHCKHVAALLLRAAKSPEEFLMVDPLEKRLGACDKPQLIELIVQMVEQHDELAEWLELALPTARPAQTAVNPAPYRRQTENAFAGAGYGWEADRQLTASLRAIQKIGDQFRAQKNAASAAAVYVGLIEGFIHKFETFQDETGNIVVVANECATALGDCLPALADDAKTRHLALQVLFNLLKYDIEFGGIGLGDDVPEVFRQHATPAERATIADWIRSQPMGGDKFSSDWRRSSWGGLLLDIEGEPDDDEAFFAHCRKFGLQGDLVNRLLERGRLDDAVKEIRAATDYEVMGHADRLIVHKQADLAHQLVRERLTADKNNRNDWQLRDWLKRFYQSRKNWAALLQLVDEDFRRTPSLAGYQEVRNVAEKLKTWAALRPNLLAAVPKDSTELIRIHLAEGDIAQAIAVLESLPKKGANYGFGWGRVDLEVAKAAEKSHPETALKIYQAEAQRQIAGRSRGAYQQACQYLEQAKSMFKVLDRLDDWNEYLLELREQHRSLRALHDEMNRARL